MRTIHYDQLTRKQREDLLKSPEGLERVLKLQEKIIERIREDISHTYDQIRDKETMAVSWMNLTVVLAIAQAFPAITSEASLGFMIACLPSFFIAILSATLTLLRHPNYVVPDFFETEDENKRLRFNKNEGIISTYTEMKRNLYIVYLWKMKCSRYIGSSIIASILVTIAFIIFSAFGNVSTCIAIILLAISIVVIYSLPKVMNKSMTYSIKFEGVGNEIM